MSTKFWLFIVWIVAFNVILAPQAYQRGGKKRLVAFIKGQLIALAIVSIILLSTING